MQRINVVNVENARKKEDKAEVICNAL